MRQRLVIGNWKMYGSQKANKALIEGLKPALSNVKSQVAVCPPFAYLQQVSELLSISSTESATSSIELGSQDVNENPQGACTGEISADMLNEFNCRYVLVGHSERRTLFGDTDHRVAHKFDAVSKANMTPVLCIGETLEQRQQHETEAVILSQLEAILTVAGTEQFKNCVIAYEPIWAIGTGKTASPEQAQSVHAVIRNWLKEKLGAESAKMQILYGGSVKADNAAQLFAQQDIDGGLIGGASLDAEAFIAICAA